MESGKGLLTEAMDRPLSLFAAPYYRTIRYVRYTHNIYLQAIRMAFWKAPSKTHSPFLGPAYFSCPLVVGALLIDVVVAEFHSNFST